MTPEPTRHLRAIRPALEAVHRNELPHPSCIALPSGIDRSFLRKLPFRVRTRNCLDLARLFSGDNSVTVGELLRLRNFGTTSLRDLLLVVEDYLQSCVGDATTQDSAVSEFIMDPGSTVPMHAPFDQHEPLPSTRARDVLNRLLLAASEFFGYTDLAQLLAPEAARLASIMGILDDLRALRIEEVAVPDSTHSSVVLHDARRILTGLNPNQRTVLDLRILASPREPLKVVSDHLHVTRQRVRQIEASVSKRIEACFGNELKEMSQVLRTRFGPIVPTREVDHRLHELFVDDGTSVPILARYMLNCTMGFSRKLKGMSLDEAAYRVVQRIKNDAAHVAEDGLIDQARLKESLPSHEWEQHWPVLLQCCSFCDVFGCLALRDSGRVRTRAALLSIGAPATREEIAELTGLSVQKVGAYLSSFSNVVRADKSRWGLSEWIDDEYEGIEAEIIQRIEEGGGVTSTRRLVHELPRRFGVSVTSVNAYLQNAKFSVSSSGHVTLADRSSDLPDEENELRALPELPNEWKIQTTLSCGSICGFSLLPRITKGLLELREVSLLELYFYLEHRIRNSGLADILKTDHDRQVVKTAYVQFHDLLLRSRRDGRISANRLEWIIPRDYTNDCNDVDPSHALSIRRHLEHSFGSRALTRISSDLWEWLPWMPLTLVKHLRTWRSPRINAIHRALFKLAGDMDRSANAFYPWEPEFTAEARSIPIQALYQYEPSSLTIGGISALRDCGLTSINDLRCLHPNAVAAAKNPDQPLLRIYRSLYSSG